MRTIVLLGLIASLMAVSPLEAQSGGKQKEQPKAAKGKEKEKPKAEKGKAGGVGDGEAPKDDAMTAKDRAVVAIDAFRKAKANTKAANWRASLPAPPVQAFDAAREYRWHLETSVGPLNVLLLPENAPMHVTSVIYLARCGFYDGLVFPRVVKGFMAQGGSPTNDRSGNAGYAMDGEFLTGQKHDRAGTVSAANSGEPHSDGSQFFLAFVPLPHLDGKHTVYGLVTDGLPTLQALEAKGVEKDGEPLTEKVRITRTWITVSEKPKAAEPPAKEPAGDKGK